jgi:hypothetical protein
LPPKKIDHLFYNIFSFAMSTSLAALGNIFT